jgi:glutamate synthase domain-containing protein 3
MTGGRVVVIGPTGRNFAAGMSGGIAYVYDDIGMFPKLCNMEMVDLESHESFKPEDLETIKTLLTHHHNFTGSTRAKSILDDFAKEVRYFVKVMPTDYRRVLENQKAIEARAAQLSKHV